MKIILNKKSQLNSNQLYKLSFIEFLQITYSNGIQINLFYLNKLSKEVE